MKRFWSAYIFFFIALFPIILHYNTNYKPSQDNPLLYLIDPQWSIFYLLLGTILWIIIVCFYLKLTFYDSFKMYRNIEKINRLGKQVMGTILNSKIIEKLKEENIIELTLELENFSGSLIQHEMIFIDSKPHEKRFEVGNKVELLLDPDLKPPYINLKTSIVGWNKKQLFIFFIGFVLIVCFPLAIVYFYINYESQGYGWRFLYFWHPYISIPGFGLVFFLLFHFTISFFSQTNEPKLIMNGIKTTANILSISQTGTYINEQPQVEFVLSFVDDNGQHHQVNHKKIIDLLDIPTITLKKEIEIMYLPEDPTKIHFV